MGASDSYPSSAIVHHDDEDAEDRTMPVSVPTHLLGASRPTERNVVVQPIALASRTTLTIVAGLEAGRVFTVAEAGCSIGRAPSCEVPIDDSSVSRVHARVSRHDGTFEIEDLGSTNGTFVNGKQVQKSVLKSGDLLQLGGRIVLRFAVVDGIEEELQRRLYETSTRDPLTGAYNRAYLGERLLAETAAARRHGTELSMVLVDVDHFKTINDTHGHGVGDAVLAVVAARIMSAVRIEDVVARFGGEEFVIVLRATHLMGAENLAERVRAAIAQEPVRTRVGPIAVTVSLGVASVKELGPNQGMTELFANADARLYAAKAGGRNRVCARAPGA